MLERGNKKEQEVGRGGEGGGREEGGLAQSNNQLAASVAPSPG